RIACSRILPNLIRSTHVHRLARFFRLLRDHLVERAPHQKLDPRIVMLGRGPSDPNYFDHAYLASYLGFPLVEGEDLTVRDGHLWLRTIEGLKLVDMVFRRVPDDLCDPLELDPASRAGIPGLLEVARRGAVGMVNPLGAGVLENPGLIPFLPRIARQFLGEELQLESLPTWWCGEQGGLDHVLANMDELVIKRIDRGGGAVWGGGLTEGQSADWRARILADPELYVGQVTAEGATTPALVDGVLEPRGVVTRCFVAAAEQGFTVMPGGFTRVVDAEELPEALGARLRGVCKDTWVIASEAERHLILWPSAGAPTRGADESLPSRAAESLYWVGRYAERGEFLTRLSRTCLRKFNESRDYGDPSDSGALTILLRALRQLSTGQGTAPVPGNLAGTQFVENTLLETVRDATLEGSLAATFKALEDAAVAVRDRWSTDTWRVIDDISEALEHQRVFDRGGLPALEDTLDRLISALMAFTGLTVESMTHEYGWQFLLIGRRVERATMLLDLLRATVLLEAGEGVEQPLLETLLLANESLMTHRRRFRASLDAASALQVIALDHGNPRSLAHQVLELGRHIDALPREQRERGLDADQRALLAAGTRVRLADASALARTTGNRREGLVAFLDALGAELEAAVEALNQAYFTHVQPTQQLVAVSLDTGRADATEIIE
ncbi:MAG: circularly permuted type 2 ATP-grasp protein, partial [Pseudomonadales bacterium]|nr:circularly permuted type 2 ATP-grasp protein [Pseudomonadales bacterium]